jgi:glucose/arabinose dehydrogenase
MRLRGMFAVVLLASSIAFAAPASVGAASPDISMAHVKLTTIATGLTQPVAFAWRNGDLGRVYVAEQHARVVIVANGHIVSTVLTLTTASGNEQGLLGFVFSADGTKLYVDYNGPNGDIHIDEFTMNGNVADVATRRPLLTISHHTFQNHNGGNLVFGPDHMLYISVGDGGGAGDTLHNGQNLATRLGKILRIDPTPSASLPYTIPAGNPFVNQTDKRGEIWMYGLRNPWRYSFDRATGDMWIGDVGQNLYEEIDLARAGG